MFASFRKPVLAILIVFTVLATGAWQSNPVVSAQRQTAGQIDTPLYPGLTWSSLGSSTQNIRLSMRGDSVPVSGEAFIAKEQFLANISLPEDLVSYYSNAELAKSGWVSVDAFNGPDGVHYVFYHESGVYLFVEYLKCQSNTEMTCVTVWKSEPVDLQTIASGSTNVPQNLDSAAASTFNKTSPSDGSTGVSTPVTLKWQTYSGAEKYTYCVSTSDCGSGTDWTSTYDTSISVSGLQSNTKYYWQIRALTCGSCSPKTWVYANSGDSWTFTTGTSNVAIVGNAGVGGATISYYNGSNKTVTADSTGAYSISLPYNWSGTITPSKTNYLFVPSSATFTNLTVSQTIQNFLATLVYVISGNTGTPGVTLSYTDGTPKTVVSDGNGNYSITMTAGWSGTVTPTKLGYTFSPPSISYSNLNGSKTSQNYIAAYTVYTISGNTGVGGVPLTYTDGTQKTILSDGNGNYSFQVPNLWSGTVTLSHPCYTFNPVNRTYTMITQNKPGENYSATLVGAANCAYLNATMGGVLKGSYAVAPSGSDRLNYSSTDTGPVKAFAQNGSTPMLASERFIYSYQNSKSYAEMMGYADSQLATEYWFPWYNNVTYSTQLRVSNMGSGNAAIKVYAAGSQIDSYTLTAGESSRKDYPGLDQGPLQVVSTDGVTKILASERFIQTYQASASYSEMMGYPGNQLTTDYWFPWYNNVSYSTQLRVSNLGSGSAEVKVYAGGSTTPVDTFTLIAGEAKRISYTGLDNGPLHVVSTDGTTPILVSERFIYTYGPSASYAEMMGYPGDQLDTQYCFPWYNNTTDNGLLLSSQLRISNMGSGSASVKVYLAGNQIDSFSLSAGPGVRKSYSGYNNGSLCVVSTNGTTPILASQRFISTYQSSASYSEMMGYPNSQLDDTYWFPWYNNISYQTELRMARP
jgi:hypothetical protein